MTIVFLLAQLVLGLYFMTAGIKHFTQVGDMVAYGRMRGLPAPKLGTLITGVVLVLGGLGVLVGMYIEVALWALAAFLVTSALWVHHFWKDSNPDVKAMERTNFGKNLALAAALLLLLGTENLVIQLF